LGYEAEFPCSVRDMESRRLIGFCLRGDSVDQLQRVAL
jgi:hypothetical protein